MAVTVVVSGAGGRLAGPIAAAVREADDLELVGLYNPNRAGTVIGDVEITGNAASLHGEVVVETVHPEHVFENLGIWKESGMAAIVGTSGFTEERLDRLHDLWGDSDRACLVVPNFSIGAVLMMEFARTASRHFESVEIVERHHSTKPDAPSGTSLATAMGVAGSGASSATGSDELVPGARGADVSGVRIHSLRLPGLIAQQEVAMSNAGEVLSVEHLSTSYDSFASGALLAIRQVGDLGPGVHLGLAALLE